MAFLVGVVGNISACHADARGSILRRGEFFFLGCAPCVFGAVFGTRGGGVQAVRHFARVVKGLAC